MASNNPMSQIQDSIDQSRRTALIDAAFLALVQERANNSRLPTMPLGVEFSDTIKDTTARAIEMVDTHLEFTKAVFEDEMVVEETRKLRRLPGGELKLGWVENPDPRFITAPSEQSMRDVLTHGLMFAVYQMLLEEERTVTKADLDKLQQDCEEMAKEQIRINELNRCYNDCFDNGSQRLLKSWNLPLYRRG